MYLHEITADELQPAFWDTIIDMIDWSSFTFDEADDIYYSYCGC